MQINTLIKKGIIINLVSMRSGSKNLVCPTGIGSLSLNVILADCSIDALIDTSLCNRHYDIKCIIKYHQNLDTFPKDSQSVTHYKSFVYRIPFKAA